ncbi:tRNA (adenosine(37)-N6)-threonylcarbamoyltransferase complex ATPase subunit type 1 TsaE [Thermoanaerobacterium thermosaccharolyticum]|mgnify:FL=1|uniref:tRNA (adenosine(37)-N6)-threonylcarbamoyltransferase complex ATPase subunit type 1 TsaE n=1 Tax=Thermoanaerobacterium thermosaccharolyticum TaxID=1517 RepID=UPI000C083739|nr:tRNA (adenosine(37)-N6)-threonylcarbamoyltransferase complex ATPase subunit type 1 TsaE [Thermoanaerobacterium thermosaccharolyticum]PHO06836.1 tRNA (adenosine(37)-N6)-threonylcarbamoyltransferase complex ATPase subunit type 1 TsaE [Thermoanaerobacterium thermosaccharolyticum]WHE06664.1 tRNA (adenosine(37)-N6)-threonylcarbamoyltransferase complex ATPase subunit type 1 TsaE [Thermoanaerobacterium thermosaccharolyticum]
MKMSFKTKSPIETEKIGFKLGNLLKRGSIVLISGELGVGKTVLTKGIAKGMGIDDYVTSPTFMIVNEHLGDIPLYHFDVYRIDDYTELYDIGYEEYFYGDGVCVIEWPEKIKPLIPEDNIFIRMDMGDTFDERTIEIVSNGEKYDEVVKEMK